MRNVGRGALQSARNVPTAAYDSEVIDSPEESPYVITLQQQRADATIARLLDTVSVSAKPGSIWELHGGLLKRRGFNKEGEPALQVYVPTDCRSALMRQLHYSNHRGHRPLHDELLRSYYWPNLTSDCATFTNTCKVCSALAAKPLQRVASNPIPTPSRPFSVLHVDHADSRGRPSEPLKYQYTW